MGLLGKYIAYKTITGGQPPRTNPFAYILSLLIAVAMVFVAIKIILTAIYDAIRSVLLIAPHLGAIFMGVAIAVAIAALTQTYTTDQVRTIIKDDSWLSFSTKLGAVVLIGNPLFVGIGHLAGVTEDAPLQTIAIATAGIALTGYYLLSIHRTQKLVGWLPYGFGYQIGVLFPFMTFLVELFFNLPIDVGLVLVMCMVDGPLVLGLAIIHYRLKPQLEATHPQKSDADGVPTSQ